MGIRTAIAIDIDHAAEVMTDNETVDVIAGIVEERNIDMMYTETIIHRVLIETEIIIMDIMKIVHHQNMNHSAAQIITTNMNHIHGIHLDQNTNHRVDLAADLVIKHHLQTNKEMIINIRPSILRMIIIIKINKKQLFNVHREKVKKWEEW